MNDYNVLAFRKTNEYPQPGKLILIQPDMIINHTKLIEANREYPTNQRITSKFHTIDNALFFQTDIELQYQLECNMAIEVKEIIQTGKHTYSAKCFLSMVVWPTDIDVEDRYIYIDAQEAIVIEPTVCTKQWLFTSTKPDQIDTFGFQIPKENNVYRTYNKMNVDIGELSSYVTSFGLKEFSKIVPLNDNNLPVIAKHTVTAVQEKVEIVQENKIDTVITTNELIYHSHPLSMFTSRLLELSLEILSQNDIIVSNKVVDDLDKAFQNLTLKSDVYIDFISDDELEN